MAKDKLPPPTFNISPNALRPTDSYTFDKELWDRVYKLRNEGRFRTALQVVLDVLDEKPDDEGTLRLAAATIGSSRSEQLQAKEPIPPGMLGDTRLDPIYTQCSRCKNQQWISLNWILDAAMGRMSVMSPAGLQCQKCGYVMCRECLKTIENKFGLGYSTYSNVCPNCKKDAMGTPVFPTGRTSMQLKRRRGTLSRVLIFREGPLVPDGEYIKEILENVYPEALKSGVAYSAFPVSPWEEAIHIYAIGVAIGHGIKLDDFDQAHGQDMDGNRLYFLRVYQADEESKQAAASAPTPRPSAPVSQKEPWWRKFPKKATAWISALFSTEKRKSVGGDLTSPGDLPHLVDNLIKKHLTRILESEQNSGATEEELRKLRLFQSPLLIARIRQSALEELRKAFLDDSHHWQNISSDELGLIVSAIPFIDLDQTRACFPEGYISFLEQEVRQTDHNVNEKDLVHWVLCSDRQRFMVHLTYLSPSFVFWGQDLFNTEERARYMG